MKLYQTIVQEFTMDPTGAAAAHSSGLGLGTKLGIAGKAALAKGTELTGLSAAGLVGGASLAAGYTGAVVGAGENAIAVNKILKAYPTPQSALPKLKVIAGKVPKTRSTLLPVIYGIENGEITQEKWKYTVMMKLSGRSGILKVIGVILLGPISLVYNIGKITKTIRKTPDQVADRYFNSAGKKVFK